MKKNYILNAYLFLKKKVSNKNPIFWNFKYKFHVKKADIENVVDKELYILQKKVHYKPFIQSPDGLVKTEIRMLYVWQDEDDNPTPVLTLARMSRGEMIGVKFNKDKDWVGGTLGLFEKE